MQHVENNAVDVGAADSVDAAAADSVDAAVAAHGKCDVDDFDKR